MLSAAATTAGSVRVVVDVRPDDEAAGEPSPRWRWSMAVAMPAANTAAIRAARNRTTSRSASAVPAVSGEAVNEGLEGGRQRRRERDPAAREGRVERQRHSAQKRPAQLDA